MRERILDYLNRSSEPLRADRILRDVLKIVSPNVIAADRILGHIVGGDARFARDATGLWSAATPRAAPDLGPAAVLYLERSSGASPLSSGRGAVYLPEIDRAFEFTVGGVAEAPARAVASARRAAEGRALLAWSLAEIRHWNRLLAACRAPAWRGESLSIAALAARVLGRTRARVGPHDLAARLRLQPADPERAAEVARLVSECATLLVEGVPEEHREFLRLRRWIEEGRKKVDFGRFGFGRELLRALPASPGVYLMRNRDGEAVYVGKARSLKSRVRSYFTAGALDDPKVARIHAELRSLEWIATASELQALLLETRLIRRLRPAVNLQAEVHEAPAGYAKTRNLILLVPHPPADRARAYFLRDGVFSGEFEARLGRGPSRALERRIRSVYFGRRARPRARAAWETEIVGRWLAANRRRVNFIGVDEAGSSATVLALLARYLRDPERLTRKVHYRPTGSAGRN